MTAPSLKIDRLPHAEGIDLPAYKTEGAAGLDLSAAVAADQPLELPAGGRALVPTGLILAIPPGHEGQVRPRSGLARDHGVTILNSPGTIDADYRGELQVLLVNHGLAPFRVTRGMRIAQLVIAPVARAEVRLTETLEPTPRGSGGFGSTGV